MEIRRKEPQSRICSTGEEFPESVESTSLGQSYEETMIIIHYHHHQNDTDDDQLSSS